jgi:WD40 repeat protein
LFNGKDLTGWRRHVGQPAAWEAAGGEIVVAGPTSHLYTVRDDFTDFHLRLEVLLEPGDESTLFVRSHFGPSPADRGWFPDGFAIPLADPKADPAAAGQWLPVEVVAQGPRIETKINARTVQVFEDRDNRFRGGRIALQKLGRGTKVRFRRLEIRDQPGPKAIKEKPRPDEDAPQVLFTAKADTPLLTKVGVSHTDDGWRIEPPVAPTDSIPLFDIDRPAFETGRLICRFEVRGEAAGTAALSLVPRYPGLGEVPDGQLPFPVTTSWTARETTVYNTAAGQKPDRARIAIAFSGKTPVFLRSVRLEWAGFRTEEPTVEVMRPRPFELAVEPLATLAGHVGPVADLAVAPDGLTVVATGMSGEVVFWSLLGGGWQRKAFQTGGGQAFVAFAPTGSVLAAGCHDGKVRLWRRKGNEWLSEKSLGPHAGPVICLTWSPDSARLATGESLTTPSAGARAHVWDVGQGKEVLTLGEGQIAAVTALRFGPDGKLLGIAWKRKVGTKLQWWDPDARKVVESYDNWNNPIPDGWDLHVFPDGRRVAASTHFQNVGIFWKGEGLNWPGQWYSGHEAMVRATAFSPDGQMLVSGSQDRTIKLRDVVSGLELATLRGHQAEVCRLGFTRDGLTLVTGSIDSTVKLWRLHRPAPGGAFVLLGAPGRKEQAFASLAAAIDASASGNVIEVRGSGPFLTQPITIKDKALTIRAGVGFWPLIVLDPHRTYAPTRLISTNAPLALEGLELQRALVKPPANLDALIETTGDSLRMAHCRLLAYGSETIRCQAASCELKACLCLADNAPAVSWGPPAKATLFLDGSLLTGQGLEVRDKGSNPPAQDVSLRVRRCTFACERGLQLRLNLPKAKLPAVAKPGLSVDVEDSVLDTSRTVVVLRPNRDPVPSAVEAAAMLPHLLTWRDRRCVVAPCTIPVGLILPGMGTAPLVEVHSLEDWNRVWGQKSSASVLAKPHYDAGGGLREGVALQAVLPESFRVLDSKAGANPGQIGPGQAYWQWRQSAEHNRWHPGGQKEAAARP